MVDNDARERLEEWVRVRADLDGGEVVFWWTGEIYSSLPLDGPHHLFGFEGVSVSRAVETSNGYDLLSREAACYLDPQNRDVIDKWSNRYTGEQVKVIHVWNDPTNQRWPLDSPRGPFAVPRTEAGGDVVFHIDIPLAYPSPLPVADYPRESGDDIYRANELFQFFVDAKRLEKPMPPSLPCSLSWTRIGPWLPWMWMGARHGNLVYQCRGGKAAGWNDVPAKIRGLVEQREPKFMHAPEAWSEPNETTWTYYRKLHPC